MKKVFSVLVALSMVLCAGYAMAEKPLTPEKVDGFTLVDADWVKANVGTLTIVDARKKGEYVENHVQGAISIPYKEKSAKNVVFDETKDKWNMSKFPSDKSTPIVVYCNGVKCWKSYKSAVRLAKAGYKKIYWLREGFPGWQSKGYPVD